MAIRAATAALVAGLLGILAGPPLQAWATPCVTACKDEITACRSTTCAGLTGKPKRQCKRSCSKSLVRDCYTDLAVCGATQARPSKPAPPTSGGGGGGTGGTGGGGW